MISTNQFKNGTHIEVDGKVFRIVDFQHVKPGKGGAFVRTKLRRVSDGAVIDKTFRAGEKLRPVRTETGRCSTSTTRATTRSSWTPRATTSSSCPLESPARVCSWILPNDEVELLFVDERAAGVQVPSAVDLAVSQTDPGLKGDTASGGGTKPATLETGVEIEVPLFIEEGEGPGRHPQRRVRLARVVGTEKSHLARHARRGRCHPRSMASERERETLDSRGEVSPRQRARALAIWAGNKHRVAAFQDMIRLGFSRQQIERRAEEDGRLVRRFRGVYPIGPGPLTEEGEWLAATMFAGPDAVLSGPAAAGNQLLARWEGGPIDVTSPRRLSPPPRSGLTDARSRMTSARS